MVKTIPLKKKEFKHQEKVKLTISLCRNKTDQGGQLRLRGTIPRTPEHSMGEKKNKKKRARGGEPDVKLSFGGLYGKLKEIMRREISAPDL